MIALLLAIGTVVGFRFHGSPLAGAAAVGIVASFGYAFSWIYATIALLVRDRSRPGRVVRADLPARVRLVGVRAVVGLPSSTVRARLAHAGAQVKTRLAPELDCSST